MRLIISHLVLLDNAEHFMWALQDDAGICRAAQVGSSDSADRCRADALSLFSAGHQASNTDHGLMWSIVEVRVDTVMPPLVATLPTATA